VLEEMKSQLARERVDLDQLDPDPVAERERRAAVLPDQRVPTGIVGEEFRP
jgi:hypothetical protein